MRLAVLSAESLGARGLCCRVETADRVIVIDPGVALGAWRHRLPPHPVQIAAGDANRRRIVEALDDATDVVFSHFHGDHVPLRDANPYQLAFSPDDRWFVTAALRLDRVDVYAWDGRDKQLARQIRLPKAPSHLWFSADSRFAYVTLQDSDQIAAVDVPAQQVAWTLPVGRQPAGIVVTPDERHLLVGIMGEDYVEAIDLRARRTVARIRTGKGAHNFRGLGDGRHLLVTNRVANTVSTVDMQAMKVVDQFALPGGPDCMELTADRRQLWVTSRFARQVTVVDMTTRQIARTIPVGRSPHGIYLHNRAPLL